jgi:DNA (cytosine-5)-methyltransferase 1
MKILNLYCGIGGNRELWGDKHEITAVEKDEEIAKQYQERFPNDTIIVGDAKDFLLYNYQDFDFIWSSPPCPTHSRTNYFLHHQGKRRYPDMSLYQEIIILDSFFKGYYCVENVISYYSPLLNPQEIGRHYFWANFKIQKKPYQTATIGKMCGKNQSASKKPLTERNKVDANIGLDILNTVEKLFNAKNLRQTTIEF